MYTLFQWILSTSRYVDITGPKEASKSIKLFGKDNYAACSCKVKAALSVAKLWDLGVEPVIPATIGNAADTALVNQASVDTATKVALDNYNHAYNSAASLIISTTSDAQIKYVSWSCAIETPKFSTHRDRKYWSENRKFWTCAENLSATRSSSPTTTHAVGQTKRSLLVTEEDLSTHRDKNRPGLHLCLYARWWRWLPKKPCKPSSSSAAFMEAVTAQAELRWMQIKGKDKNLRPGGGASSGGGKADRIK